MQSFCLKTLRPDCHPSCLNLCSLAVILSEPAPRESAVPLFQHVLVPDTSLNSCELQPASCGQSEFEFGDQRNFAPSKTGDAGASPVGAIADRRPCRYRNASKTIRRSLARRCARVGYVLHAHHLKNLLLFRGGRSALDRSVHGPNPRLPCDFHRVTDMSLELVSFTLKLMCCPTAVGKEVMTVGIL
jgi:hypothetical protein